MLTLPAIAELRATLPDVRIRYLTRARYAGLLELSPQIDEVEILGAGEGLVSLARRLQGRGRAGSDGPGASGGGGSEGPGAPGGGGNETPVRSRGAGASPDMVLDLHRSLRSRIVSMLLGRPVWRGSGTHLARRRMVGRRPWRGARNTSGRAAVVPVWQAHRNTVARMVEALVQDGRVEPDDNGAHQPSAILRATPLLEAPLEARQQVAKLLSPDRRAVALLIGAQWANKRWPVACFTEVGRGLAARGLEPVIIAGPPEAADVALVAAGIEGRTHTSTGAWGEVVAWLERCEAAIGNDSGMTHLAEALGVPVVALFGPTVPGFGFAPRLPASRAVERALDCRPCSLHGAARCPLGHHACLRELEPAQVLAAFDDLWAGIGAGGQP